MRLSGYSAAFVGAMAAAVMAACGGAEDPLGGPYGGTMAAIGPNGGNVGALSDQTDAAGDDASTRGANSSGGVMGSGVSADDAGEDSATPGSDSASGPSSTGGSGVPSTQASQKRGSGIDAGHPNGGSSGGSSGIGGSSSGSSGTDGGGSTAPPAPTWSKIFSEYLTGATIGNCTACHGEMGSAPGAYSWLSGRGYISGTASPLVTPSSCLTWFGGNMPPGGPFSSASAQSDMRAWAAAGAKNN